MEHIQLAQMHCRPIRELGQGMSRVRFVRNSDNRLGQAEWVYSVGATIMIKYCSYPVVEDGNFLIMRKGVSPEAGANFCNALKRHRDRWLSADGWEVDLPSEIVVAVNECFEDVRKEEIDALKNMYIDYHSDEADGSLGHGQAQAL